jgi:hypothetical protein
MDENFYNEAKKTYLKYYTNAYKLISTAPKFNVFSDMPKSSLPPHTLDQFVPKLGLEEQVDCMSDPPTPEELITFLNGDLTEDKYNLLSEKMLGKAADNDFEKEDGNSQEETELDDDDSEEETELDEDDQSEGIDFSNCGLPEGDLETRSASELTFEERHNFMKELVKAAENYRKAIIKISKNPHREMADSALDLFDMTLMCFVSQVVINPNLSQPSDEEREFYMEDMENFMRSF